MTEANVETIEVTQADPASGNLELADFRRARAGETLNVPKEAPGEIETPPLEAEVKVEDDVPVKVEAEPKPKVKDPKPRIEKLTREKYELEDERERLRARVQELEAAAKPAAHAEPGEPMFDDAYLAKAGKDGKTYEQAQQQWKREHDKWTHEQFKASEAQEAAEKAQTAQLKEVFDGHNARMMEARQVHDDLDDVVKEAAAGGNDIPRDVGMAIMELENGPEVLYHLCTDKLELLKELGKMSPLRAVAKVGALADSLLPKGEKKEPVKPSSKAPDPITPVGTGSGKADVDPENMSLSDFRKFRSRAN